METEDFEWLGNELKILAVRERQTSELE